MPSQTTRIRGDATWRPCLNKAAMLILDIYDYPDDHLTAELKAEKARLWDYWERGWSLEFESGMFCQMYYPKVSDELTKLDVCPPCLVFRGSEMNEADLEELAISINFQGTINGSGAVGLYYGSKEFTPKIPVISPAEHFSPDATEAQLRAGGLRKQYLIMPSSGKIRLPVAFSDIGLPLGSLYLDWHGSAALYYGQNGDWPTNISQALGQVPDQYDQSFQAAKRAAEEAMSDWNGRLMVLGHSLGGGLASAAALSAKKMYPNLAIRCNTYNAAGLHTDTAAEARTSLSEAAGAGITAYCVKGDILTSLQTRGTIPLVSDILRWAGKELPPAIPNAAPTNGFSPGGDPGMMFSHFERAPKWSPLPNLFPLNQQSLVYGDMETIGKIFEAAARAQRFEDFVENIVSILLNQFGDDNDKIDVWKAQVEPDEVSKAFFKAGPEILAALKDPPPTAVFPQVSIEWNEKGNQFINGLIRDTIEFTQIMSASVDYHMWDACAYTFLLEKPNDVPN